MNHVTHRRVALTQSPGRLDELQALLEARGFEVLRLPLVETVTRTDPRTRFAAVTLTSLPWLLITSRSTVEALVSLGALPPSEMTAGLTQKPLLGAIGPATAAALEATGARAALVGTPHNARGLAQAFLAHPKAMGPVGLARGNRALDTLERELGEAGFATRTLVVYDTRPSRRQASEFQTGEVDVVVLASPSAVEALPTEVASYGRLVTLGSTTSKAVHDRGWECEEADEPSPEATLAAIERVLA
ncbi:MAG: uroporphyrinogen-III synthase [Trueperaceae bacterium]